MTPGSTAEGRPYFAMEYVPGIPITEVLRQAPALDPRSAGTVRGRLRRACSTPTRRGSSIATSSRPTCWCSVRTAAGPKIIDFGVAKATAQRLTDHTVFTELGQVIGTPEYMSPEQAEMTESRHRHAHRRVFARRPALRAAHRPAAVRCRGASPGRARRDSADAARGGAAEAEQPGERAGAAIRRSLRRTARVDVRTLGRAISGDLDWITMKALEKDRERRYETAQALALDVGRHLNDQPVLARPPSGALSRRASCSADTG